MARIPTAADQFDSPWKATLQLLLQPFAEFFFPDIAADVDWSRGYESLDKELEKIARQAKIGKLLADKLFKVWLKDGSDLWLLVHIEVQGDFDEHFAERMFRYNIAAYQMYNTPVISLAALCDDNPDWRPSEFRYGRWGCETAITFRIAKLLDFQKDLAALQASDNPIAAVVFADRMTRETRHDPESRRAWKLRIVQGLYRQNWTKERILQLFEVIDWLMALPDDVERAFWQELGELEEKQSMRYITSVERLARADGKEEGQQEGLLEGVGLLLKAKFGRAGLKVLPQAQALEGLAELRKFSRFVTKADSLEQVRDYFK